MLKIIVLGNKFGEINYEIEDPKNKKGAKKLLNLFREDLHTNSEPSSLLIYAR